MEPLYTDIVSIIDLPEKVREYLENCYKIKNANLNNSLERFGQFLGTLRDDLFVFIEYPYVDKTYRDTYYNYFASKKDDYPRNTIRLSFFKIKIVESDFRSQEKIQWLQDNYLGFLIIRPTFPFIIGRNVIDPNAFKNTDFVICKVRYNATVNGIKLYVLGFPHSSQDQETITCAETTVWSILEYFGHKYAEYRPSLPSQVNDVLGKFSFERLIPSKGLTAGQISYALKEFGFGVKIYSKIAYNNDFERLLRIYVESGIPIVGVVENSVIGHALNIIGRSNVTQSSISKLKPIKTFASNVNVFDFADIEVDYIFIDDNYPAYRTANINSPSSYYSNPLWNGCTITNFIVPLYPKIYMEAGEARKTGLALLEELNLITNKDILIKNFLTSSRSFKNELALNSTLNDDIKDLLLSISMPKFVWVMEITDMNMIMSGLANGMVILDATEPKRFGIIAAIVENFYIANDLTTFTQISVPLQPFSIYKNNLN